MRFRFGRHEVDSEARLLLREGEAVEITPKALQLLELLLAKRPAVVSKEAILEALWPDTYVAEANIPNLVNELRRLLGDTAKKSKMIRTAHGSGYAFCARALEYRTPSQPQLLLPTSCSLIGQGWVIPLGDGEHVLGRHADCEVQLASAAVSRRHAKIRVEGKSAVIEELRSRNDTFVQGRKIAAPVSLADGDKVRIGDVSLRFRVLDPSRTTTRLSLRGESTARPGPRRILGRS